MLALSETLQQHRVESRQMFEDMLQRLNALSPQQPPLQPRRETIKREIQAALAKAVGAMLEDVEVSLARESELEDLLVVNACVVLQARCFGQGADASLDQGALCDVVVSAVRGITGGGCISGEVMSASIPGNVAHDAGHKVHELSPAFEDDRFSLGSDEPSATDGHSATSPSRPIGQQIASSASEQHMDEVGNTPNFTKKGGSNSMVKGSNSVVKGISRRNSGLHARVDYRCRLMTMLDKLVKNIYFEVTFLFLILVNTVIMAAEAEYDGYVVARDLGLGGPSEGWQEMTFIFETLEFLFGCIFIVEVVLKILVFRKKFFQSYWCDFDLIVVILWIVEKCAAAKQMPTLVLRISRLIRALRLVRLTKTMWFADTLSLMVVALKASLSATVWSILLIFTISMCSALLMTHVARGFILGDVSLATDTSHVWSPSFASPEERREQLYLHFGTFWRSFLTVLELTVGNWVPVTRMVQECMNEWLAVAILMYQMLMGFAFLKVVQGVFLHETFRVAKSDNELMIRDAMRDRARFKHQMEGLLSDVDEDRSGYISKDEFHELFGHERVGYFLGALGLDVADKANLWRLVMEEIHEDERSSEVSVEDLAKVIGRIRGHGRSIDLVTVLHKLEHVEKHMEIWSGAEQSPAVSKERSRDPP